MEKNIWKKRSVVFDDSYWSSLEVRHCLDVIHVETNVCDRLIETLFNIRGKTKYANNARLDLTEMGIIQEFPLKEIGKITYFPPYVTVYIEKKKKLRLFGGYQSSPRVLFKCQETCVNKRSQISWVKISWLSCIDATTSTNGYSWYFAKKSKGNYNEIMRILICYL